MQDPQIVALNDILNAVRSVKHTGTQHHLRSAFIALSNHIVRENFPKLGSQNMLHYRNHHHPDTLGGVTVSAIEYAYIFDGRKLEAIKEYKNRTGKSLVDSKRDIEDYGYHAGYYPQGASRY